MKLVNFPNFKGLRMNVYKMFLLGLLLVVPYFLTGCGEDDITAKKGADVDLNLDVINSTVVLPINSSTLVVGSEVVNIDVNVFDNANNPLLTGEVKVIYPDSVQSGVDVGSFENNQVELNNGTASFVYTAPSKLNENASDIVFGFYHSENLDDIKNYTFRINPITDQIILNEYELTSSVSDDNYIMNLEDTKQITFYIKNKDGILVSDDKTTSIEIMLLNLSLGDLQGLNGTIGDSLTILNTNSASVNILSNTISGTIPINVKATFVDENGDTQILSKVYNVVILSGPASAISLSYSSTAQDAEYAKFIENWILTVTDRYNNRVNTNPTVSMGMIAGYAKDATLPGKNPYDFIFYEPDSGGVLMNSYPNDLFFTSSDIFTNVNQENEILVLFGDGYTYDASGKWDFYKASNNTLNLVDEFDGATTSNLGFAVGNNFRQDTNDQGVEWVANVYPRDINTSTIDDTGKMIVQVEYDYYLTGKDVVLWVNLTGKIHNLDSTARIGEAKKITLRAQGIEPIETCIIPKNTTTICRIHLKISNTTENYRNARMGYKVEVSNDSIIINSITDSNNDIINNRITYVDINVTSDIDEGGTVALNFTRVNNEFN